MRKDDPGRINGFLSGSEKIATMDGDPHSFITQIQLYNEVGLPIAVASLSKPLMKNFSKEAVIKVKLSY